MNRMEGLALSIAKMNGAFDTPESKAFSLCNPGLLKTYRPEKKVDSENYRVFTTVMGGFKALLADLQAKTSGKNHRLSGANPLKDLLSLFGFTNELTGKKIVLFLRRALNDDSITLNTNVSWFTEK